MRSISQNTVKLLIKMPLKATVLPKTKYFMNMQRQNIFEHAGSPSSPPVYENTKCMNRVKIFNNL